MVLFRAVKTAKTIMISTPLNLTPLFRHPDSSGVSAISRRSADKAQELTLCVSYCAFAVVLAGCPTGGRKDWQQGLPSEVPWAHGALGPLAYQK